MKKKPEEKTRKERRWEEDYKIWERLSTLASIAGKPISSGSAIVDARINAQFGGYRYEKKER